MMQLISLPQSTMGAASGGSGDWRGAPPISDADSFRDTLSGKRILLVEDEVFIAFDLRHFLEEIGAEVVYARNLREAKAALHDAFDGAVLDVTLGQGDTCKPIAEELAKRGTPFLLHSGDLDRQGEMIRALVAPVIAKPAPAINVIGALAGLLAAKVN